MSMIGYYTAIDEDKLDELLSGDIEIDELDVPNDDILCIDKTWHAIMYTLCHSDGEIKPPMGYVVPIQEANALESSSAYGSFYLTPDQVRIASEYLDSLDDEKIMSMYDFEGMLDNDIYPITSNDTADEFYDYIYQYLILLIKFFRHASAGNMAITFCIE